MSYEVQLWRMGMMRYRLKHCSTHETLEDACEEFAIYVQLETYPGFERDYHVLLIDTYAEVNLLELYDSERLYIDCPDGLAAARLVSDQIPYHTVEVFAGDSDDPIEFARCLIVSVDFSDDDRSISNAETILRRRSALGLYTEFLGNDLAIWRCMRFAAQFPTSCGNVDAPPLETSDPDVDLVNFL